jgi:hypothetical protein
MRRLLALGISLPLIVAGGVTAHWLTYLLAVPEAGARRTLLLATGHAYQTRVPVLIGALGGASLVLLAAAAVREGPLVARLRLSPAAFVALPVAGFALQEFGERLATGYAAPWHVWLEPAFWRGVLLQIPFALIAYIAATLLLRAAVLVERAVARRRAARGPRATATTTPRSFAPSGVAIPRRVRDGDALRFRGPPATMPVPR